MQLILEGLTAVFMFHVIHRPGNDLEEKLVLGSNVPALWV
jgi:hypothetical protein